MNSIFIYIGKLFYEIMHSRYAHADFRTVNHHKTISTCY